MPPTPSPIFMRTTLVLSALVLLSAIGGVVVGAIEQEYFVAGFEAILALGCVLGVLTGLGKFNSGPSIAIACAAGTMFVVGVLGGISIYGSGPVMGIGWKPYFAARVLPALALFACAGGVLLARKPTVSLRLLIIGVALGAPVVLALGALWKVGAVRQAVSGMNTTLLALLATPLAILAIGLLSASAHCVIRAFEIGIEEGTPDESAQGA